ncbi:Asp-tRNA(Asn)/Glu-tRNA(Gln) amidotransferase subunit GatC [Halanaerobium praevalens]|uniref:Aspartyl/glutamyl-tRNA(Asn/Gln) amidotransferase subunit C n=1 Tax=Halanaerobium praevalens (strain ATCC 33744 / DSM 2228 / GSL) TaxID=572479 RepID=E3DPF6_HALPG|nr:Asp-tRNA(Asn)/Glu-tRNA(Gln) amidotransferase subunit GatC [Halanaerobium praevalens]ADO77718.1 aspartyl/glutamyl-tRNA(Asn/Gln) amidotransferase subunit C [Halanaerobium praevalens DSM 2228]
MINQKEVEHAAKLAKLNLDQDKIEKYTKQIGAVLDYVDKLSELDTKDVIPTAYTVPMKNVLREDKVEESLSIEKSIANAPDKKEGQFRAPKIMSE